MSVHFPHLYRHEHPPVRNINELFEAQMTFGQRTADTVARVMGSWPFILIQTALLTVWVILNVTAWVQRWDPYPFILMNLLLSMQAAYAAPAIMMSQNRQAARDRLEAHHDYLINVKAEEEVRHIMDHLAAQDSALMQIHEILVAMRGKPAEPDSQQDP